jgi:hypothetical protein
MRLGVAFKLSNAPAGLSEAQVRTFAKMGDRSHDARSQVQMIVLITRSTIASVLRSFASTVRLLLGPFSPIFNGAYAIDLKHKTKQNQANSNAKELIYAS